MKSKKQKAAIFIVLALLVSLVIQFYQPVPVMAAGTISKVKITGVTPPEAGVKPTLEGIKTDPGVKIDSDLTRWRVWQEGGLDPMDLNDPFEAGEEYCIEIHVVPEAGYAFADTITALVNGENATEIKMETGENFRKILLEFPEVEPKRYVSHVDIFGVTLPKAGENPTLEGIYTDSEGFVIDLDNSYWSEMIDSTRKRKDPGTLFEAEKDYWLYILVCPDAISGFADTFTALVNGKLPAIEPVEGANAKWVVLEFSLPREGDPDEIVSKVGILGVIPPQIGKSPTTSNVMAFPQKVYIKGSVWRKVKEDKSLHEMASNETFEKGTEYWFVSYVFCDAGYKFPAEIADFKATVNGYQADIIEPTISGTKTGMSITRKFSPLTDAENKMTKEPEPMVDGSADSASFTSGANVDDFQYVMFGDEELHPNYYEVNGDSGSTNVTINYDFVKTLDPGSYVVKIVSKTGTANGEIVILKEAPSEPDETDTPTPPVEPDETDTPTPPVEPDETDTPTPPAETDATDTPTPPAKTDETSDLPPATGESRGTALWLGLLLVLAGALFLISRKIISSKQKD